MRPLSRRSFLQVSGLAVLGVAAGCGDGGGTTYPSTGTLDEIMGGRRQRIQAIPVGTELLSGIDERVAWGLIDPEAKAPFAGGTGRFWFARQPGEQASGPYDLRAIGEGLAGRGVFVAEALIPSDGIWFGLVELSQGEGEPLVGLERFQVGATNEMPKPGDDAVSVATPTVRAPRGVDPICTLNPPCGMHEVSLDAALDRGDPIVLSIGTPAFCQTRFCGPITELIDGIRPEYPDVTFIHIELLRDDENDTVLAYGGRRPDGYEGSPLAPATIAWQVTEEPVTYYIATDGTIAQRHMSALDSVDLRAGIDAIT